MEKYLQGLPVLVNLNVFSKNYNWIIKQLQFLTSTSLKIVQLVVFSQLLKCLTYVT